MFLAFEPPSWVPPGLWDKRLVYLAATAVAVYLAYWLVRKTLQSARNREIEDTFRRSEQVAGVAGHKSGTFSSERARLSSDIHEAVQSQNFERAAGLYLKAGNHAAAARMYLRIDAPARAAPLFEQAGALAEAADAHEQAGNLKRAAELHRQLGNDRRAERLVAGPTARPTTKRDTGPGRPPLELPGRADTGGGNRSELIRLGKFREAAELSRHDGDRREAAALFERAEAWAEAAEVYGELHDRKAAARCLFRLGKNVEAIRELKSLRNPLEAASFCEEVRQFYSAGRFFEEAGRIELAQRCYLQVASLDDDFRFALGRAVALATELGEPQPVIDRLRPMVEMSQPSARDLPRFLAYGRMLMLAGRTSEAARLFETLRAEQLVRDDEIPDELLDYLSEPAPSPPSRARGKLEPIESLAVPRDKSPFSASADRAPGSPPPLPPAPTRRTGRSTAEAISTITKDLAEVDPGQETSDRLFADLGLHPHERYQLTLAIGEGGAGEVFLARDVNLSRRVVIKFLKHDLTANPTISKYFVQEARVAAQLTHPNIVTIHDVGVLDGRPFIVMEYLQGDTLDQIYEMRSRPITRELNLAVISQLSDALAYAHAQQIVHRDIKGENVMITVDGVVKLMDFGVAKVLNHSGNRRSVFVGTPLYMAPEMIVGQFVDQRADIYAFGILLFLMFTGRFPFESDEVFAHHLHTVPPDPRTINPNLPPQLAMIILRCLEKDRERRFPDVPTLKSALLATV